MFLQMPKIFEGIGYYQGLSLILWGISIATLFCAFVLLTRKASKLEMNSQRWTYFGYGFFCFCFAFTRLFFLFAVFTSPGCDGCYDFYTTLGYIWSIIGIILWLYVLETYLIKKTKRMFMIITAIAFVISLISLFGAADRYLALTILYIILPFAIGAIILLYFYLIIKTTGTVRKQVTWLVIGLFLLFAGHIFDSEFFIGNFSFVPLEIAPILMIIGTLLFIYSQMKEL